MRSTGVVTSGLLAVCLTGCGSASPAASSTTTTPSGGTTSATTGSTTSTPTVAPRGCGSRVMKAAIARTDGAAGSTYLTIRLTNGASTACTLTGYPGVSIVGHDDGTQIGTAAVRDRTITPKPVRLAAGGSTTFVLRVVQAGNYPAVDCQPVVGDGLRIYPPDSTRALFLPDTHVTGCAKTSVNLLTVRPVGALAG